MLTGQFGGFGEKVVAPAVVCTESVWTVELVHSVLRERILARPQAGKPLKSGNTAGNTQRIPKQLFL